MTFRRLGVSIVYKFTSTMYTSKKHPVIRRGFTLIELLIVIAILGLLMGVTTQMLSNVGQTQGRARAKADMAIIGTALEAFSAQYGSYPRLNMAKNSDDDCKLYKCLTGRMVLRVKDGRISMSSVNTVRKPFIDVLKFNLKDKKNPSATTVDPLKETVFLADPWDEPYQYFYDTSVMAGALESEWKSPSFILLTKGADTKAKEVRGMYSSGMIPPNDVYTEPEVNIDNYIFGRTE